MHTFVFHAYRDHAAKSSALVYLARFLVSQGHTVGVIDLDLEAPCMHYRLLSPDERSRIQGGLVDDLLAFAERKELAQELHFAGPAETADQQGKLVLLPAGAAPRGSYFQTLAALRKSNFFHGEDAAIVPLLLEIKEKFESQWSPSYLFLDTHSGVSELGGIALAVLADTALCFVDGTQESLEGTQALLHGIADLARLPGQEALHILPVVIPADGSDSIPAEQLRSSLAAPFSQARPHAPTVRDPVGLGNQSPAHSHIPEGMRFGPLLNALFGEDVQRSLKEELDRIAHIVIDNPDQAMQCLEDLVKRLPHSTGYRVLLQFYRFRNQFDEKCLHTLIAYAGIEREPDAALLKDLVRSCAARGLTHSALAAWMPSETTPHELHL